VLKKLNLFILKAFIGPMILTFFVALFILQMQWLFKYIDDLIGKGLDTAIILELFGYATATLIPMALPLSILLASIMTFGNLGEHFELLALKSSGISLLKIMRPLIVLTAIVTISAFFFSNYLLPVANLKMNALLYDVKNQSPEISIKEGAFFNDIEGYSIKVNEKNTETGLLKGIMIYNHTERRGNVQVTLADSGYMNITADKRYMLLDLYQGATYDELLSSQNKNSRRNHPLRRDRFEQQSLRLELEGGMMVRTDEGLFKRHFQMMNLSQLSHSRDSLQENLAKRKLQFGRNILRSSYFKNTGSSEDLEEETDTLPSVGDTLNLTMLITDLSSERKSQLYKIAANFARSTKSQITTNKNDLELNQKHIYRHEIEWHRKFSLSFACLLFFFIGAPFGSIVRKGGFGMPVVLSVLLFILYYVISMSGEKFVREGVIPAWEGMWLSAGILLPMGLFLTYKAVGDSVILNVDSYFRFMNRFVRWIKKINTGVD
jgi:lipopolysaccharide export system permease protein